MEKYLICQDCGKQDETVKETTCPFAEEIHDKIEEIIVCDECYQERVWDI